ncbi:MAG: hypothetical protein GIKADHBN_02515 [Phycisphaerales bacterium]|nr:hypothetical protein [Phycisphaerales bacterium]
MADARVGGLGVLLDLRAAAAVSGGNGDAGPGLHGALEDAEAVVPPGLVLDADPAVVRPVDEIDAHADVSDDRAPPVPAEVGHAAVAELVLAVQQRAGGLVRRPRPDGRALGESSQVHRRVTEEECPVHRRSDVDGGVLVDRKDVALGVVPSKDLGDAIEVHVDGDVAVSLRHGKTAKVLVQNFGPSPCGRCCACEHRRPKTRIAH